MIDSNLYFKVVELPINVVRVVCRHEPPVLTSDVLILQKEPDVVTVCKPASIPVSRIMTYLPSG